MKMTQRFLPVLILGGSILGACGVQEPAPPALVDPAATPDLGSADATTPPADLTVSCKSSAECDDGNPCTADVCAVDNGVSTCVHKPIAGCTADLPDMSTPPDLTPKPECVKEADCNDGDPCTTDICVVDSTCFHHRIVGCGVDMAKPLICNPGYADCDGQVGNGCEVSTANDVRNCGACGMACGQGESCEIGQCKMLPITAVCRWSLGLGDPDEKMVRLDMGIAVNNGPMLKVEENFNPDQVATPELVITGRQNGLKSGDRLEVSVEYETTRNRSWSCLGQGNAGRQVGVLECRLSNGDATLDAWSPVPNGIGGCNLSAKVP